MVTARLKLTREQAANLAVGSVRVKPANEANRVNIRHPSGIRFRASVDDVVTWPNDAFSKRRISDGSVIKVEGAEAVAEEPVVEPAAEMKRK
jgi:hypothetical protein